MGKKNRFAIAVGKIREFSPIKLYKPVLKKEMNQVVPMYACRRDCENVSLRPRVIFVAILAGCIVRTVYSELCGCLEGLVEW
jgi:hypothetical protein